MARAGQGGTAGIWLEGGRGRLLVGPWFRLQHLLPAVHAARCELPQNATACHGYCGMPAHGCFSNPCKLKGCVHGCPQCDHASSRVCGWLQVVWAKVEGHDWWPAKVVRRRAVPREVRRMGFGCPCTAQFKLQPAPATIAWWSGQLAVLQQNSLNDACTTWGWVPIHTFSRLQPASAMNARRAQASD